ncbi:MAG: DUF4091 domain-containing protein [Desulfuromonadales bacterium]|nr:MAG: DUF4091 domain-containing protein [Desulfuromonadales bacterium]
MSNMILNKLLLPVFVFIYSLIALINLSYSASNIALNKRYTVSPIQNYQLSALLTDNTTLTDGKYSSGYFWTQKSTVGWKGEKRIEILIDLESISDIGRLTFNTARGQGADVYFPAHVYAFIGSGMDDFKYVGDIVKSPDNTPGIYKVKKFELAGINARGRYLLLEIIPRGYFAFCDEIEVFPGNSASTYAGNMDREAVQNFTRQLERLDIEKEFLSGLLDGLISKSKGFKRSDKHCAEIRQDIDALSGLGDSGAIETAIFALRGEALRARFPGRQFLQESINPWAPMSPIPVPNDKPLQDLALTIPLGGYDHAAFVVTNLKKIPQEVTVQPDRMAKEAPGLAVYGVPFVKSAAMEYVADPLVPANGRFTLRPGESRMVFLTAHGEYPGRWRSTVKVGVGADVSSVPLDLHVANVALPSEFSLNSINWGYLDFKPIKARRSDAVNDLVAHHTNVAVIPAWHIPFSPQVAPRDLMRMEEYQRLSNGASKVLYFFNFNEERHLTVNGKYRFMSHEWKKWFKEFYPRLVKSAARAGFTEEQLYLYPFDEMHGQDVDRFVAFASWARKEIPSIKFYGTLERKEALKSLPYLDIAQVIDRDELFEEARNSKKEIWIYGAADKTKSLSPYAYYRLMSWKAFYLGFKGAGFWNYADTGSGENPGSAWDDFDGNRPDFAVIYEGKNGGIVSSRRWEAWRMGVEDYELLTMYARFKGDAAARELAKKVLSHPGDTDKADETRRFILREMSR